MTAAVDPQEDPSPTAGPTDIAATRPVVATRQGKVRGVLAEDGVARFLGIPYAAPPFGELRFERPQPHQPWAEELDASKPGASPPQTPYRGGLERLMTSVFVDGDDILNLNIWTPAGALDGGSLPVVFWIYGGALTRGCNALPLYDGSRFARDGVVFVGINYRVGIEGFAQLDGAPDNRGLADAVAALEWVRDEVAAFGGDPSNVTVLGQSAGGLMVTWLLASPRAEGLFSRAVVMSAAMGPAAEPPPRGVAAGVAELLDIPQTKAAFAVRAPDELASAQTQVMGGNLMSGGPYYHAVAGDELLPDGVWEAFKAGRSSSVPVVIGTTAEEHRFWYVTTDLENQFTPSVVDAVLPRLGVTSEAFALYRRGRPGESAAMTYGALLLDLVCRPGMNTFADNRLEQGGRTWVYEFAWRSPALNLGAAHAVDLPFLFDQLETPEAKMLIGGHPAQQLADDVHGAILRFAIQGDPGWESWHGKRPVMTFDSPRSSVVYAPREAERLALTQLDS